MPKKELFTHDLKITDKYWQDIIANDKTFEIRKNDRDYKVGDYLLLRVWDAITQTYTGSQCTVKVTYMTSYMQKDGFVVLGIEF